MINKIRNFFKSDLKFSFMIRNSVILLVQFEVVWDITHNGFGYGFVAEKSAGIFPMNNEYTKKR